MFQFPLTLYYQMIIFQCLHDTVSYIRSIVIAYFREFDLHDGVSVIFNDVVCSFTLGRQIIIIIIMYNPPYFSSYFFVQLVPFIIFLLVIKFMVTATLTVIIISLSLIPLMKKYIAEEVVRPFLLIQRIWLIAMMLFALCDKIVLHSTHTQPMYEISYRIDNWYKY